MNEYTVALYSHHGWCVARRQRGADGKLVDVGFALVTHSYSDDARVECERMKARLTALHADEATGKGTPDA